MHHGIYNLGCIWQPFCILQEKVGISFYFWIIRVVNSQLAWYSHVRCNPLNTPKRPLKHPQNTTPHMTVRNLSYEGSYLPGLMHHMGIKADLGRSASKSTPPSQMHHGIYMMGCIWQPFWILQEKVGISFYFWIIRVVNSQLAWYSHVRLTPLTPPTPLKDPKYPPHDNYNFQLWELIFARCNM